MSLDDLRDLVDALAPFGAELSEPTYGRTGSHSAAVALVIRVQVDPDADDAAVEAARTMATGARALADAAEAWADA